MIVWFFRVSWKIGNSLLFPTHRILLVNGLVCTYSLKKTEISIKNKIRHIFLVSNLNADDELNNFLYDDAESNKTHKTRPPPIVIR